MDFQRIFQALSVFYTGPFSIFTVTKCHIVSQLWPHLNFSTKKYAMKCNRRIKCNRNSLIHQLPRVRSKRKSVTKWREIKASRKDKSKIKIFGNVLFYPIFGHFAFNFGIFSLSITIISCENIA